MKDKNNFFNQYASASVYIQRKNEEKKKNDLKEYRLGLLSAGSTSYNNVIIPMLSLTRQPSNFFNDSENEKSFGNDETTKNKKNYMTYRKKNIISGNLKQNQKRRNMSSYSKKANEEEFKDVEKLIPKFHKIKKLPDKLLAFSANSTETELMRQAMDKADYEMSFVGQTWQNEIYLCVKK